MTKAPIVDEDTCIGCGSQRSVPRYFEIVNEKSQETMNKGLSEARFAREWDFVKFIYRKKRDLSVPGGPVV